MTEPGQGALTLSEATALLRQVAAVHRVPVADGLLAERLQPPIDLAAVRALLAELGIDCRPIRAARRHPEALTPGTVLLLDPAAPPLWPAKAATGDAAGGARAAGSAGSADSADSVDSAVSAGAADASGAGPVAPSAPKPPVAVVLARRGDRLLLGHPGGRAPRACNVADLTDKMSGIAWHTERRPEAATDPDGAGAEAFGWPWFGRALLRHRRLWRDVVLASLVIQLLALAMPLATQAVVDKVVVHRTESTLIALGVGLVLLVVASSLLGWMRQYLVLHTGNRVDAVLASAVFARLIRLPIRFFEQRPTGTLTARLQGIEQVREFIAGAAVTLVLDVPFIAVFLAIMAWYSLPLTAVVVGALALIVGLSLAVVPRMRRLLDAQFLIGARNQAFVTEHLAGIETVKSVQMEAPLQARYEDNTAQLLDATLRTRQLGNSFNTLAGGIEQLLSLAILFVGAWLVMTTRDFTIGMLVAFQMFSQRLSQPVMRAVGLWQQYQQTRIAVRRLADIMDVPSEPHALKPARTPVQHGALRIEQLAFRHGPARPWLFRGLSLDVPAGSAVALMGPSGCGKSSLAKLLLGMYPAEDGRILLDGQDVRSLAVNELRRCWGVVPQETVLFSGTVLDNLLLGQPHAHFEQVVAACRMAEVHEVIEALPEGYQTRVGERGVGLSGGQRQRLAIARALLRRPKLLLFDEATSNLDAATAQALAHTLNALKGRVTMVFIAHQLPRALQLDAIVRLDAPRPAANEAPAQPHRASAMA